MTLKQITSYLIYNVVSVNIVWILNLKSKWSGTSYPWLVITDFGAAQTSLSVPYTSYDYCIGGNAALMAPEIITAEPGPFSTIDYSKSDLWSGATMAYEIFGDSNPFYGNPSRSNTLVSATYDENNLPECPNRMPKPLRLLIKKILKRNPDEVLKYHLNKY